MSAGSQDDPRIPPTVRAALVPRVEPRHRLRRVLGAVLAVMLLALGGVAAYAYFETRAIVGELSSGEKREVVDAVRRELAKDPDVDAAARLAAVAGEEAGGSPEPVAAGPSAAPAPPATPADPPRPAKTILMIGSDRRWGDTDPARSDTILLVRIDGDSDLISMLSLPRDLLVPIPGYGQDRINAAYALGGAALLTATVRDYLGVRIDHFAEVTFGGFGDLVGELGGVLLPVDQRYYVAPNSGHMEIDLLPGYQRLRRNDALSFVRFRHYDSDLHRAARQQLFLREVKRQIQSSKYDVLELRRLVRAFAEASASDIDSIGELLDIANAALRTPPSRFVRATLEAYPADSSPGAYLVAGQAQLDEALSRFLFPRRQVRQQIESERRLEQPGSGAGAAQGDQGAEALDGGDSVSPTFEVEAGGDLVEGDLVFDDGGVGETLIEPLAVGMRRCAPTALPRSFSWPSSNGARQYVLEGSPAIAAYASAGSGESMLLMQTTMREPPVLAGSSTTISRAGIDYEVWLEAGTARQIAWRLGPTRIWLTNTLRNRLSVEEMLAVAESCRPL